MSNEPLAGGAIRQNREAKEMYGGFRFEPGELEILTSLKRNIQETVPGLDLRFVSICQ